MTKFINQFKMKQYNIHIVNINNQIYVYTKTLIYITQLLYSIIECLIKNKIEKI